jgi:hypothetical protein
MFLAFNGTINHTGCRLTTAAGRASLKLSVSSGAAPDGAGRTSSCVGLELARRYREMIVRRCEALAGDIAPLERVPVLA